MYSIAHWQNVSPIFSFYESGVICATTWIRPTGGWSNCFRRMRSLASNYLASKISISVPTVRTRLRNLLDRNLAKIVGLLNLTERPELVSAIVGINVQGRGHTHEIARRIADVPFVNSASVVTGRFDISISSSPAMSPISTTSSSFPEWESLAKSSVERPSW